MGTQLFANNASSTLASAVTNSSTSLSLAAGEGSLFPNPTAGDWFLLTLTQAMGPESSWEIVRCTARSADTLTVVRAQEGTVAVAWSTAKAELRLTAAALSPVVAGGASGLMTGSDKSKLDGVAPGATNFSLPVASGSVLGGVKVGAGLSIDAGGILSAAGATNIAQGTRTATTVGLTSSTGTGATLSAADASNAGVMAAADKVKLDAISGTNTGDQTNISGNAGTATTLQTARTIAGTSFNGSANIGITYGNLGGLPTLGTAAAKNIPATGDATATEVVYGTDTRLSNSRAASDVYAWAKAAAKPSYTAAEVGAPSGSGSSTGNNTGDQTNISGNATTATGPSNAINFKLTEDRGRYLRETSGGTMVAGAIYGLYTGGGPITMYLPTYANANTGDSIRITNLHLTWASNAFTVGIQAQSYINQVAENMVCNSAVGGFDLVCVWKDGSAAWWNVI